MRTLIQLKQLFRQKIKVITGGPANLTRGEGMLAVLDALAEELKGGAYAALTLTQARALPAANPPGVAPNALYAITGDWNATGTDSTVHVQGVRADAYHRLGVVYNAQGVGQLVEIDVAAGTYEPLSGQTLYDALGDQTDGAPTNRLLKASLDGLDQRKPWLGYIPGAAPRGYDLLDDALANFIAVANCSQATVDYPTVSFNRSFFANGAQISINDAIPVDDGSGNTVYIPGTFGVEAQAKIHSIKLIPADYYDPNPVAPKGTVKTFRAYPAGFAGLPTPADCTEFHSGSLIGYKLGLNGAAGGYVLINSQATAGTTSGNLVIYLFGTASISGPLGSGTTVVQPPGVAMPYTGTATRKMWVVKGRTYSSGGKEYKWLGADTQLNAFDATNANWLQTGGASSSGGGGTVKTVNGVAPDANGDVQVTASSAGVATPSGTVLAFTQDAEYSPIYSGTFTVNPAGARVGTTVFVELGAAASAPSLDASVFELAGGAYASGKRNEYGFRVAASGKIHYVINQLP